MKRIALSVFFLIAAAAAGCSPRTLDIDKSLEEIETDVKTMPRDKIERRMADYAVEINKRGMELSKLVAQQNALTPREKAGTAGKELQERITRLNAETTPYAERYAIYSRRYEEKTRS